MKAKIITITSICLSIILMMALCRNNTKTKKHLQYGDDLNHAIEEFEDNRQDFTYELNALTRQTSDDLSSATEPAASVAENWEQEWNKLSNEFESLKKDFETVGKTSSEYFLNLDNLASSIQDQSIRQEEQGKNKILRGQWERAYNDAAESIRKVERIMYDGNDFYNVLIASSIRQQVQNDIRELESITLRALSLLADLEEFSTEGKRLINRV